MFKAACRMLTVHHFSLLTLLVLQMQTHSTGFPGLCTIRPSSPTQESVCLQTVGMQPVFPGLQSVNYL